MSGNSVVSCYANCCLTGSMPPRWHWSLVDVDRYQMLPSTSNCSLGSKCLSTDALGLWLTSLCVMWPATTQSKHVLHVFLASPPPNGHLHTDTDHYRIMPPWPNWRNKLLYYSVMSLLEFFLAFLPFIITYFICSLYCAYPMLYMQFYFVDIWI